MPEPLVYMQAMAAAAVGATLVLTVAAMRRGANASWQTATSVAAITMGLALGYYALGVRWAWPPGNSLDRLLMLVVPAALSVELIAGYQAQRWAWLLRLAVAATIPHILLHGSVYLSGTEDGWTQLQTGTFVVTAVALLAGVWGLLSWLSHRSPGASIGYSISLSILSAGMTVMLAGYITGGAAAFPFAATLFVSTVGGSVMSKRSGASTAFNLSAILGMGVVGLFSLLFIGRFFGGLSTGRALVILLAPLLCWATELPVLRHRTPWQVGSIRLVLVATLLSLVLILAKQDFDRDMGPLLKDTATKETITAVHRCVDWTPTRL